MTEGRDSIDPEIRISTEPDGAKKIALMIEDVDVSRAWVTSFDLRFGKAVLRMGGIGGVGTQEDHRYKGYSRRVMEATVRHIQQSDAALATLFGISGFYDKFGFAPIGPDVVIKFRECESLTPLRAGFRSRPAALTDIPAMRELYNAGSAGTSGIIIRRDNQASWVNLRKAIAEAMDECRVVVDVRDRIVGYAWRGSHHWYMQAAANDNPGNLDIAETFAETPIAADAVIEMLAEWRLDLGLKHITMLIPHETNRVALAAQRHDATVELHYNRNESYMGRATGSRQLLQALLPDLCARWTAARIGWRGTVEFAVEGERTVLQLTGNVTIASGPDVADIVVELSAGEFARLVFRAFDARDILERAGVDPEGIEALSPLFPRTIPYIYPADRF